MKLISVNGLEILSAPQKIKEIDQKAREIWLFGYDFLSVVCWFSYNVDRRISVTEIRHQLNRCNSYPQ